MRRWCVVMASVAACGGEPEGTSMSPPPVRGFDVVGDATAWRSEPYRLDIQMPVPPAPASGVDVWVPVTDGPLGRGVCHPAITPDCLGITGTLTLEGPVSTVANGQAELLYTVPPSHPTSELSMQGIVLAGGAAYLSSPWQAVVADPPPAYAIEASNGELYSLDMVTQTATVVGPTNLLGPTSLAACGAGHVALQLFAADVGGLATGSVLYTVDAGSGQATAIGPIGFTVVGLACDGFRGQLRGITSLGELIDIDTLVAQGTIVGNPGLVDPGGFAWLAATDSWYVADDATDALYVLDPLAGTATQVGGLGLDGIQGLAGHNSPWLYGVSQSTGELVHIDPLTGTATGVWSLPNTSFTGITF